MTAGGRERVRTGSKGWRGRRAESSSVFPSSSRPRPHKGPLRPPPSPPADKGERKAWERGPRGRNLVAEPGGCWEFWRTKAGARDSSVAPGAEAKGSTDRTLCLLPGRQDSWVPAQLCSWLLGHSGHPPSPLSLSFPSLLRLRKYTGFSELTWTGDHILGEERENQTSFPQTCRCSEGTFQC